MKLGVEFSPGPEPIPDRAWAAFAALEPRIAKVRLGSEAVNHLDRIVAIMRRHTREPWLLFRPSGEVPTAFDLWLEFDPIYRRLIAGDFADCEIRLECANEPNHPQTRLGLGAITEEQLETYRQRLIGYQGLRRGFRRVALVTPGLMPGGDADHWLLPERDGFDYDGIHVYHTQGLAGLMVHSRFTRPLIVTEFGYDGDSTFRRQRNLGVLEYLRNPVQALCIFILPWNGMGEWERFELTVEDAAAYAAENKEEPMPPDYLTLAHEVINRAYMDSTGGEGFNPATAFSLYANAGMPNGPIRQTDLVYYQAHALGTLVAPVADPQPKNVRLFLPGLDGERMLAAYLALLPF